MRLSSLLATFLCPSVLLVTAAVLPAVSDSASGAGVVDTGYARYRGNHTYPNSVAYLGIPYAEPPLGERRFRAPLPLNTTRVRQEAGGRVVDATTYPDQCVQGSTGAGDAGGAGSEDCLNVNIYAPVNATKDSKLPVLVYIHGGGYVFGNPRDWPFDHWIQQSPHAVVVSVYYRLDAFGFLSVPELGAADLNAGFRDQIEALRWTQAHIGAFGGDPARVTINGQSAGGSSIELHLVAHEAAQGKPLFAQAIAQSVYRIPLPTPEQQRPLFVYFAQTAGCGEGPISAQLACLRQAPVSVLARAQDDASFFSETFQGPYRSFHPVVDGEVITDLPTRSIQQGNFARVPLIVGSTSNETLSSTSVDITVALKAYFPALDNATLEQYPDVYPRSDYDSDVQRRQVATGESELICARTIIGQAAADHSPTFTYRYNQPNPTLNDTVTVGHAAENWMMFMGSNTGFNGSVTFSPMTPTQTAFAEELIAYWLSFVRAGNPNTFKLARSPVWPLYSRTSRKRVALQQGTPDTSGSDVEAEPKAETARCEFVARQVVEQQN